MTVAGCASMSALAPEQAHRAAPHSYTHHRDEQHQWQRPTKPRTSKAARLKDPRAKTSGTVCAVVNSSCVPAVAAAGGYVRAPLLPDILACNSPALPGGFPTVMQCGRSLGARLGQSALVPRFSARPADPPARLVPKRESSGHPRTERHQPLFDDKAEVGHTQSAGTDDHAARQK